MLVGYSDRIALIWTCHFCSTILAIHFIFPAIVPTYEWVGPWGCAECQSNCRRWRDKWAVMSGNMRVSTCVKTELQGCSDCHRERKQPMDVRNQISAPPSGHWPNVIHYISQLPQFTDSAHLTITHLSLKRSTEPGSVQSIVVTTLPVDWAVYPDLSSHVPDPRPLSRANEATWSITLERTKWMKDFKASWSFICPSLHRHPPPH